MEEQEFKIEKGIPIPKKIKGTKYPWGQMEVGDSFFVVGTKKTLSTILKNASNQYSLRHHNGIWQYEVRKVIEHGVPGVRVWRIEDKKIKQ